MWLETKYRAWEEKYKTMYYEDDLGVTIQDGKFCIVECGWDIQGHDESVILLKYIGDVINRLYRVDLGNGNVGEFEEIVLVSDIRHLNFLGSDTLCVTVLGNIYENKELINSLTKEEVAEIDNRGEF
jgi:hypothetical protein